MSFQVFTSITANYIPKARVLAHSIKRFHPDVHFTVVLSDEAPDLSGGAEPFDSILLLKDLGIPKLRQWIFKHTLVELSTAVKGFALLRLLETGVHPRVLYFDPDIVVLAPLDALLQRFESASILLTPHLSEPETSMEGILDNELSVLQHGVFNLGFVGVQRSAQGLSFARWWADRLTHFCVDDIPRGLFTDQRWVDLAPAYFDSIGILREPVYNVATWNLSTRQVDGDLKQGLRIGDQKIVFYHFSGLDSGAQMDMLNKYGRSMAGLYELREWYLRECDRMGQASFSKIRWVHAYFDNGEKILPVHRKRYREREDLELAFPDPFATGDVSKSYYHWFNANDASRSGVAPRPHRLARWQQKLQALRRR